MEIAGYILLGIIGLIVVFGFIPTMLISNRIFSVLFVRHNKEKWSRAVSWDDPEQKKMFEIGENWGASHVKYQERVSIQSDKFTLVGEYFDFGYNKAVIIIPGRTETCAYSYFYAKAYEESGYNILAIDNRSHGLSDGRYNTIGLNEYKDLVEWSKFLRNDKNISQVILHGICIGSATALYAAISDEGKDYISGVVADGMYTYFKEILANHIIERKHMVEPCATEVMAMMRLVSGKSSTKRAPINVISKLEKPILFIYSRQDTYALPAKSEVLYAKCTAPKQIAWFPKGAHSHVRINNTEEYDNTIKGFLGKYFPGNNCDASCYKGAQDE